MCELFWRFTASLELRALSEDNVKLNEDKVGERAVGPLMRLGGVRTPPPSFATFNQSNEIRFTRDSRRKESKRGGKK